MSKTCYMAFHVTCARRAGLQLRMRAPIATCFEDYNLLEVFCERHCTPEYAHEHDLKTTVRQAQQFYRTSLGSDREYPDAQMNALGPATSASSQPQLPRIKLNLSLKAGSQAGKRSAEDVDAEDEDQVTRVIWKTNSDAPIIPHVIYKKVCERMSKYGVRKRKEFVSLMCKYWTLKKEIRRGAALLKRLQVALEVPAYLFSFLNG